MSDLLGIGSSGVRAYQAALNVVGENIANAGTKGYVRREATLVEQPAGAGRQVLYTGNQTGLGVRYTGVSRQWDAFRAQAVRVGTAESGRTGSTVTWLQQIERALTGPGLSASITRFFNSAEGVAADPTGIAPRAAFLDAASSVATAFTATADGLATVMSDLDASARLAATELNGMLAGLAEANAGLSRSRAGSSEQAQLLDRRDQLIDGISALTAVHVDTDDNGVATLRLNDKTGPLLVHGTKVRPVDVAFNASGTLGVTIDPYGTPETAVLRGGSLAGLSDAGARLSDLRARLEDAATAFAEGVNQVQAAGRDLDGQPGADIFDASAGGGRIALAAVGTRQIAAARPWTALPNGGNVGSGALKAATASSGTPLAQTRITVGAGTLTATDPVTGTVIGTASFTPGTPVTLAGLELTLSGTPSSGDSFTVSATAPGSRDNGNLAGLKALRTGGKIESQVDGFVTENASALAAKKQVAAAQDAILEGAITAREEASGVNLDQEAVDLMRFQQAYQASSRIIQVARDTFDAMLNAVG